MAPLPDLQLEHFARALARGASPFAALVKAGIKRGRAEADHLAKDARIAARVAELRPAISQEIVTTPEKQFRAFEEVRLLAMAKGDPSGAVSAIVQKARLIEGVFGAVPFREGGFREPMTNRERAIRILKHVVRELKRRGSAGTAEVEAVINKLAGKHTVLSEDLPPICEPSSPAQSRIAALTQLLQELDQAHQLAMRLNKISAASRAIKAQGKLQEQLTTVAAEREKAEDLSFMGRNEFKRRLSWVLRKGINDPDGVCS